MANIQFTSLLKRFFNDLAPMEVSASNASDILIEIEKKHPGFTAYIVDEQGQLRKHVNIFIDGEMITDRNSLSDEVGPNSEVFIMQALSGG